MGMKEIGCTALAVAVGAAALAGCGSSEPGSATDAAATAGLARTVAPATGEIDHLDWALPLGEPRTLDPSIGADFSPTVVSSQMCESLLRLEDDFSISSNLAESARQVDPRTLVFTLHRGVRFWDGQELTSADVVYSLDRSRRPEAITAGSFQNVAAIRATGRYEVTVTFSRPDELFRKSMSNFTGAIVEKRFAQRAGRTFGSASGGLMCTGPFKLSTWKSGTSIELERNDDYWNPDLRAHARTVSIRFLADSSALTQALLAGEVDGAYEIPPATIPALLRGGDGTLYGGPSLASIYLAVMDDSGPLQDVDLRRALFGSIDREGIARVVFHGAADPSYTQLPPNIWDPEALDQWRAAYEPFVAANRVDAEEAKALVARSPRRNEPIVLAVVAGDATQSQVAQVIQQSARAIGLTVRIRPMPATQFAEAAVNPAARRGIDLSSSASFGAIPDPVEQLGFTVTTGAFYNYTNWSDPQVDRLVAQARTEFDAATRTSRLVAAQKIFEPVLNATTLTTQQEVLYLNDRLGGAPTSFAYLFEPSLAKIGARG